MKSYYKKLQMSALALSLALLAQGCGMELTKDDPGHPGSHPNAVTLKRSYQHVLRYNCDGSLRDDDVESVSAPTQWVSVHPSVGGHVIDSHYSNRQNGDTAHPLDPYLFEIKFHTRDLGLKVERGLNVVDYQFMTCANPAGADLGACAAQTTLESGTVSFDVTYVEETLPGTREEHVPCPSPTP